MEFKLTKSREYFHFNPVIQVKGNWKLGIISLEVYNAIFNITEHNKNFELYTDNFDEFLFEELKVEVDKILHNSVITPYLLQHETIGPSFSQAFRKLRLEKSSTAGYIILLMAYAGSPFRDFESYLRIVVGLDEDDNQLILK